MKFSLLSRPETHHIYDMFFCIFSSCGKYNAIYLLKMVTTKRSIRYETSTNVVGWKTHEMRYDNGAWDFFMLIVYLISSIILKEPNFLYLFIWRIVPVVSHFNWFTVVWDEIWQISVTTERKIYIEQTQKPVNDVSQERKFETKSWLQTDNK